MKQFFDQIIYSAANEDPVSEIKGLKLMPTDKVLCVTGSGARVLDLLSDADCQITAVDFNAKQNHLLELKVAAFKNLDYDSMLDFLGINNCKHRTELFTRVKRDLTSQSAAFWEKHFSLIHSGVIYQGTWEKYMRHIARMLLIQKKSVKKLFSCQSLETQQLIWNEQWKSIYWSALTYLLGRRFMWKYIMQEPGIDFVPNNFDITTYIKNRFDHIANTQLFANNPYLNLLFHGKYHHDCLPIHFQEKYYNNIKARVGNITFKNCSLQQILSESEKTYTAFSLSDFSSYANREDYDATWKRIIRAAKTNAKFVERRFLVKYHLSPEIAMNVNIDDKLSKELSDVDHSFIYDIRCGRICPKKS